MTELLAQEKAREETKKELELLRQDNLKLGSKLEAILNPADKMDQVRRPSMHALVHTWFPLWVVHLYFPSDP